MKHILLLWVILLLNACRQQSDQISTSKNKHILSIDSIYKSDSSLITELNQTSTNEPKFIITRDIILDTTFIYDKLHLLTIEIILPKTKGKQLFSADKLLNTIITDKKNQFVISVDKMLKDEPLLKTAIGSEFIVSPVELYKDKHVLSYLLYIEVYRAGAPHPKSDYFSFNYDIKRKKQIKFYDYFIFQSKNESDSLLKLINSTFKDEYIKADEFYDFDFNFNEKTINFNFDDYEIASYAYGMQRATIDKTKLFKYIKAEFRQ
ncbi:MULTISPECIES: DUF3298 domain-containing protein [unclassified Arcicella]|uniref:RsiV family protein n=1 Tax=unclassified Arcicella TaxID=2644986 RepID=UPI0028637BAA|nr:MULTISPECIES: DUF3298 domain-containing protein [unclassified Arcicella]MDR6560447.1 hypothetical protein [Arcicella sp. BE51]MDR6809947.1 hypothetical protein [Arcicella sp. BE140]MDR6821296.1 hypothetical protein [Arcicella sp. BE139]